MSLAASIVVRSYNEEKWLGALLASLAQQDVDPQSFEVILVDSGSNDQTVAIAEKFNCRINRIKKSEFTFGRSLNVGCRAASGRNLVFISAHCVPTTSSWLRAMIEPLEIGKADYVYGRQVGHEKSRFSEKQIFSKYYPVSIEGAQGGFFCNNANAALRAEVWNAFPFDENLTGLEDLELAKRLLQQGRKIEYIPEAAVYHIHEENWVSVRTRYEREALALQQIMPEVHIHASDFLRYLFSSILHDVGEALLGKVFLREFRGIFMFRLMQYWGAYRGNNDHRRISRLRKERYFYPK